MTWVKLWSSFSGDNKMIFPQCGWLLYLIDEVFSPYALHAKRVKYKVDTKVAQHSHPIKWTTSFCKFSIKIYFLQDDTFIRNTSKIELFNYENHPLAKIFSIFCRTHNFNKFYTKMNFFFFAVIETAFVITFLINFNCYQLGLASLQYQDISSPI